MPLPQLPTTGPADLHRDLRLALHTASSLQATIRHADAKARNLLAVQGGIGAVVLQQISTLSGRDAPVLVVIAGVAAVVWLCGLAASGRQLLTVISPRLTTPDGSNRFAFPAARPRSGSLQDQRDEAWDLVSALAGTATAKHEHVRRSLPGLFVTSAAAGVVIATTVAATFLT